jgi:nucleoside-diphosphate-sugar epimerase
MTPAAFGEALNLGSGAPASLAEIANLLVSIAGRGDVVCIPFPDDARRIEIGDYVADTAKVERLLGWRAETSLEDGLRRSVEYYTKHREHYW